MINDRGHKKWTSLMLPEHKEMLKQWRISQDDVIIPTLDESRIDELDMLISECMTNHIQVSITFSNNNKFNTATGFITKCDALRGNLTVTQPSGQVQIQFKQIIDLNKESDLN